MTGDGRPDRVFDPGLQHERTALAWERTAIATMVAGLLLARYVALEIHPAWASIGVVMVVMGAGLLVWAGHHYEDLHGPLRAGQSPLHPTAARVVGASVVTFTAIATVLAALIAVR